MGASHVYENCRVIIYNLLNNTGPAPLRAVRSAYNRSELNSTVQILRYNFIQITIQISIQINLTRNKMYETRLTFDVCVKTQNQSDGNFE